jgi:hypothetical protein
MHTSAWTVGTANNTPAFEPEALPARYRRTASLSTYTHIYFAKIFWISDSYEKATRKNNKKRTEIVNVWIYETNSNNKIGTRSIQHSTTNEEGEMGHCLNFDIRKIEIYYLPTYLPTYLPVVRVPWDFCMITIHIYNTLCRVGFTPR